MPVCTETITGDVSYSEKCLMSGNDLTWVALRAPQYDANKHQTNKKTKTDKKNNSIETTPKINT